MFQASLEKLFDRYRTRGDAAALAEIFDRTSPELLKLAMHLVRETNEAEDVLQNTYLAAIESAASFDSSRQLVPWLVGILAKQASLARRRARREIEPDRLHEPRELEPNDRADLAEFSSKLAAALDALPEPYREVLRLHLADGRKPIDIARELGRAPGTVRMQVHRGIDLLRRALPAGFAAGAALAAISPRGLAAVRERVLVEAVKRAPTGTIAATGSTALGAALIAKLGLALAALSALAWWALSTQSPERASDAPSPVAAGAVEPARELEVRAPHEPVRSADDGRRAAGSAANAGASSAPAGDARRWLVGHVSGLEADELPFAALEVRGLSRSTWPADAVVRGAPERDGSFRLDVTALFKVALDSGPLEQLVLTTDHPRCAREETRVEITRRDARLEFPVAVALTRAGVIEGSLRGVSSAQIALVALENGVPETPPIDVARSAANGRFRLRARDNREHALVAFVDGARPLTRILHVAPSATLELGELNFEEGAAIEGSVLGARGAARDILVGANRADLSGHWCFVLGQRLIWHDERFERGGTTDATDASGRFRLDGLEPGEYRVQIVRSGDAARAEDAARRVRTARAPGAIDLELDVARVHLSVLDADGAPASGKLQIAGSSHAVDVRLKDGSAELDLAPNTTAHLLVVADGSASETFELATPDAGEERAETVRLRRATALAALALTLNSPEGISESELELEFFARADDGSIAPNSSFSRKAAVHGSLVAFEALPAGSWRVGVHYGGKYRHYVDLLAPLRIDLDLAAGRTLERTLAFELGGRLRVHAVDETGAALDCACKLRNAKGELLPIRFLARTPERVGSGADRLSELAPNDGYPNLAPGEYVLTLSAPGRAKTESRFTIEPAKTTALEIVVPHTE